MMRGIFSRTHRFAAQHDRSAGVRQQHEATLLAIEHHSRKIY